jgi:tetratricopeptide (TPR) repeat protein
MFQIDPLCFIPQSIKEAVLDTTVDFLSGQAKKLLGDEIASKIKQLRTDAAFHQSFENGLKRALERFKLEYEEQDEDIVAVILSNQSIFKDEKFQAILQEMIKRPGSYLDEEREKVISTFESILPGRKNRQRVDRAVSFLLRCIVEEVWHIPELQPIYSLQFQRMTAEATRQQVEIQKAQLIALAELNAGVRQSLLQLTDAIAKNKLLPDGKSTTLPQQAKVLHNLPNPDYSQFIGREKELTQLLNVLRPYPYSQHSVITIDGIGGIGKSALALEAAYRYLRNFEQIPAEERFNAVIWISAKREFLSDDGIKSRPSSVQNLQSIFSTIAIALNWEAITRARPDEQLEVVRKALINQRTLLIIDNLETLEDEDIYSFLRELPAPTKAILTTRYRIDVAYRIQMNEMKFKDAEVLINQVCNNKKVSLNVNQKRQLYEKTGGVPLAIVLSISKIGFGFDPVSVIARLGDPNDDISRFCFKESMEAISNEPAAKLIMALTLFAKDANKEVVGNVAGYCNDSWIRDLGFGKLDQLSLIQRKGDRISMLPLTKQYMESELRQNQEFKRLVVGKWTEWIVEYTKRFGHTSWDWRGYKFLDLEIENILSFIDKGLEEEWPETLIVLKYVTFYMKISGRWNESNLRAIRGIQLAEKFSDDEALAFLSVNSLGWTYGQLDELDKAEGYVLQGLSAYNRINDSKGLAITYRNLGQIKRKKKDFKNAEAYLTRALEIANVEQDISMQGNIIGEMAKLARDKGDKNIAWELFTKANDLLANREQDRPVYASLLSHMAYMKFQDEDLNSAKSISLEGITIFNQIGGITDSHLLLAQIYFKENNYSEALQMAEIASWRYERTGEESLLLIARDIIEKVSQKTGG